MKINKRREHKPKIDRSGLYGFILIALVFCYLIFIFSRNIYENFKIKTDIGQLKTEIDKLAAENEKLKNLIIYYGTNSYKEKEARSLLNLRKEGEAVIAVPKDIEKKPATTEETVKQAAEEKTKTPNLVLWWRFFFKS